MAKGHGATTKSPYSVAADDDERRSSRGFPRRAALVQCRCRHRRRRLYLVLLEGCSVTRPFLPSVTRWMTAGSRGPPSRTRRHISVIAFRQKITIYHIYDIQCKTAFHNDTVLLLQHFPPPTGKKGESKQKNNTNKKKVASTSITRTRRTAQRDFTFAWA